MRHIYLLRIAVLLSGVFVCAFSANQAEAGRIRLRKVKDAPKVCSVMSEDRLLSRSNKKIFGTLRNSVILENDVSLVNDLGKKICQWPVEKWQTLGDLSKYTYYIDEQRNKLYPYVKAAGQYQFVQVDLDDCEISDMQISEKLEFPKCQNLKKSKARSKRRIAGQKISKNKS